MRTALVLAALLTPAAARAHPGHRHDDEPAFPAALSSADPALAVALGLMGVGAAAAVVARRRPGTLAGLTVLVAAGLGLPAGSTEPADDPKPQPAHDPDQLRKLFDHFKADGTVARVEGDFLLIDSTAFPRHPLMVGITAWQQQVPLPQPYTGRNAWRLPLKPTVAAKPVSARTGLFRGAIAVAVNGVPIFNALNNRGEDAFKAGELDEYGGHCGRGDDYHYHVAPVHLEAVVGKGRPIAYALDGFPVMGYADAAGKEPTDLDEFNGRYEADGRYVYYATRTYPYLNGGMRGTVTVRGDQIEPQPKDSPVRPAGRPLRGAKVTAFDRDDAAKAYTLRYTLRGREGSVAYTETEPGVFRFVTTAPDGPATTETFRRRPPR